MLDDVTMTVRLIPQVLPGEYNIRNDRASSTTFILVPYMKVFGYLYNKAYEGMRKKHLPGGIMGKAVMSTH